MASSEPDMIMLSLNGLKSVSKTAAVCPLNNGTLSGALPTSSTGITANAPPPEEFQLTEMYLPFALRCQNLKKV